MNIREMVEEDYDQVYQLWLSCAGMGLNDLDDSKEGIARFLQRNPQTCLVAVENQTIIGCFQKKHRRKSILGKIRFLCSRRSHLPQSSKD